MARRFLYIIAAIIVLVLAALFALRIWGAQLYALAMVPSAPFEQQAPLAGNAYADPAMWYSHPQLLAANDPARWQPGAVEDRALLPTPAQPSEPAPPPFAVFFVHPTSYLDRTEWNAPLGDPEAERVARIYLRGMASPFNAATTIWAPRYRQATLGAFLTDKPEGQRAFDTAYRDVEQAFGAFVAQTDPDLPIVLAGHSQGALHLLSLLDRQIAGTPMAGRIAAVYAVGWPISTTHDLPQLGLPACSGPDQPGCIQSWASYAEPADPALVMQYYHRSTGLDGQPRGNSPILCTNPLTGATGGKAAPAARNLGTLKPDGDLGSGSLVPGAVPARCDARGILLIGDPPEMGRYVLPGNDYHVYDIPLFWANVQADVARRVTAWAARK